MIVMIINMAEDVKPCPIIIIRALLLLKLLNANIEAKVSAI